MTPRRRKAESRAADLLKWAKITTAPIPVEDIAKKLRLEIIYENLPPDTSSVLIRQPDGQHLLGVNASHPPRRRRFSLAHELGHALLHFSDEAPHDREAVVSRPLEALFRDGVSGQGTSRVEIEANTFAAALLMPQDLVKERFRLRPRG